MRAVGSAAILRRDRLGHGRPPQHYRIHALGDLARGGGVKTCVPEPSAQLARTRDYLPLGLCPGGVQPVLKYVAAMEGDVVEVSATGMRVNGRLLPRTAPQARDSRERPLRAWPFGRYVVSHGEAWLIVPLPRSFDSRYFGPVAVDVLSRRMALVQRF